MATVLVADDNRQITSVLEEYLKKEGYTPAVAFDGTQALRLFETLHPDAVLLDVMMPGKNGFEVVREMRHNKNATPVLLLTARDDVSDKVAGLDCGADDYMTKPFSPQELLARVRALSRRQGAVQVEQLEFEDILLNLSTCELLCGAKSVRLGFKEFEVMKVLLSNPNMVISKSTLISKVWGVESEAEDNNVEAYISFLRKKLFFIGSRVTIETQRKVGYRLGTEQV